MRKQYRMILGVVLVLVAGVGVMSLRADEDEDTEAAKAAGVDVKKLADQVGDKQWADLVKAGLPMARKHKLIAVMTAFKPRARRGIGIGAKPNLVTPDGIELKINNMARSVREGDLKYQKELIRMAEISAAVAGIAVHHGPDRPGAGAANPARWKILSEDMFKQSRNLIEALESDKLKGPAKTKAVKGAAMKLNTSCNECHRIFRDS